MVLNLSRNVDTMRCPSKTNSTPYAKTEIGLNLLKQKETSMNLTETLHGIYIDYGTA